MFAAKPGCPMCGIVASAASSQLDPAPRLPPISNAHFQPDVLWRDDNFTAYREITNPVSTNGHIIIAFNLHVPSLYALSSSDIPLLAYINNLAKRLLVSISTSTLSSGPGYTSPTPPRHDESHFQIGFITPPFKDNKIPVTDHLHAHAYITPADRLGWWRSIAYSPIAWYSIDDLIAEIRESTSNNRVKSGHEGRANAPITSVPEAGARMGSANGDDYTIPSIAILDVESDPGPSRPLNL